MPDPRVSRLAKVIVRYSTSVKPGERVLIRASSVSAPLVLELECEILAAGAFPVSRISVPGQAYNFYRNAKDAHLRDVSPLARYDAKICKVAISILDDSNTRELTSIHPEKVALRRKSLQPLSEYVMKHVRWCLTLFPTEGQAQDADMSLAEYQDFVYATMFCNRKNPIAEWNALERRQESLTRQLNRAKRIQILGKETDLTMDVRGRKFINSSGHYNMPSGEVFTAPLERSVEGTILYEDFPTIYGGREVSGVFLRFKNGKVVEASAEKNEAFLLKMLDLDRGARYLGELGIGTNFGIQRFTRNILFDEKIGGTIHLALGRAYEECLGTNKSALHWDMIKDLRKHGKVLVDGKPLVRAGRMLKVRT